MITEKTDNVVYVCFLTVITEIGGGQQNKKATIIQRNREGLNHKYTRVRSVTGSLF